MTYFHGLGAPRPRGGPGAAAGSDGGKGGKGYGTPRVGAGKRGDEASEPGSAVETLVAFALFGGVGFFTYRATSVPGSAGFRLRRQLARHLRVL